MFSLMVSNMFIANHGYLGVNCWSDMENNHYGFSSTFPICTEYGMTNACMSFTAVRLGAHPSAVNLDDIKKIHEYIISYTNSFYDSCDV